MNLSRGGMILLVTGGLLLFDLHSSAASSYVLRQFTMDGSGQLWPAVWTNSIPTSMIHYGGAVTNVAFEVDPLFRANRRLYEEKMEKGGEYPLAFENPPYPEHTGYSTRRWDASDGLPSNHVRAIHQTSDGFLWIATNHGLARFDGREFVSYERANSPPMEVVGANCLCIAENDEGEDFWVGTENGLLKNSGSGFEVFDPGGSFTGKRIQALAVGPDSRLWVGTRQHGLFVWNGSVVGSVNAAGGVKYGEITGLGTSDSGVLGIVGSHGVDLLYPGGEIGEGISDSFAYGVYPDGHGRLWFSEMRGAYYLEGGNLSLPLSKKSDGTRFSTVLGVVRSNQGETLGIEHGSQSILRHSDLGRWESLHLGGLPGGDTFTCAYTDRVGGTWLGMHRSGLVQLNPQPITMFSVTVPARMNDVRSIAQGIDGTLWMATGSGFIRWRGRELHCLLTDPSHREVTKLILPTQNGHRGDIEIEDGVTLAFASELGHWRFYGVNRMQNIELGGTQCSYLDPVAGRWVGGKKGIYRVTREWRRYYTIDEGLSSNDVRSLVKDERGVMWIGTYDGGLNRFESDRFSSISVEDGLSDQTVWSLNADLVGTLWVGTGRGLSRVFDTKVFAFKREHGMPEGRIYSLLTDDHGYLWLGMPGGLIRVLMSDLNAVADGRKQRVYIRQFDEKDGLESGTVNGEVQPCAWKCSDGRLLFATPKGLAIVEPDKIPERSESSRVLRIDHFVVDGEEIFDRALAGAEASVDRKYLLAAGRGQMIQIHYSVISFDENDDGRYSCRMEGYETEWHNADAGAVARYNRLPPGDYRFCVDLVGTDGKRARNAVYLTFSIAPYFYQTAFFYPLTGSLVILVVWIVHRWRLKSLERAGRRERELALECERRRIARDAHDQIGSNLSRMILALRRVEESSDGSKIAAVMRNGLESASAQVRDLIWTVDPRSDRIESVVDFLVDYAEGWTGDIGVKLDVVWPEEFGEGSVSGTTRHQLVTVFKEALTNIGRHAEASSVQLGFHVLESNLVVKIEDDGRGVLGNDASGSKGGGNGLKNMHQRMEEIGGSVDLIFSPERGLQVEISVPLESSIDS